MSSIDERTIVARHPDILHAVVNGEVVLMSVSNGEYYGLDAVGSDVWERLAEPTRVEALLAALEQHYRADEGEIRRDTVDLLGELLEKGLLQIH
ncbi:PqqD family protein [Endothiovibrio diazotrophicus]